MKKEKRREKKPLQLHLSPSNNNEGKEEKKKKLGIDVFLACIAVGAAPACFGMAYPAFGLAGPIPVLCNSNCCCGIVVSPVIFNAKMIGNGDSSSSKG